MMKTLIYFFLGKKIVFHHEDIFFDLPPPSLPRNKKRNSLLNKDLLFNLPIYFKRWKTFFINFRFCFLMVNKKIFLQMCARVCQALAYYQFLIYIKNIYCIIFSYFKYILNKHYLLFRFIIIIPK